MAGTSTTSKKNTSTKKGSTSTAKKTTAAKKTSAKNTATAKKAGTSRKKTEETVKPSSVDVKEKRIPRSKEKEPMDPYFEDTIKDFILWGFLLAGLLVFIAGFGVGGKVGAAICGFLFGVFGIVQYLLPIAFVAAAFFIIANLGNKVAVLKVVLAFLVLLCVSIFAELVIHSDAPLKAVDAFKYSREMKNGGGFFGGAIAFFLINCFGRIGAFITDIVVFAVSILAIFEQFTFIRVRQQTRYHEEAARIKREERRLRQELERQQRLEELEQSQEEIRSQVREDLMMQQEALAKKEGPRIERVHTGVTNNTTIAPDFSGLTQVEDPAVSDVNMNVVSSNRRHLKSDISSSANLSIQTATEPTLTEIEQDVPPVIPIQTLGVSSQNTVSKNEELIFNIAGATVRDEEEAEPIIEIAPVVKAEPVKVEPIKVEPLKPEVRKQESVIQEKPEPIKAAPPKPVPAQASSEDTEERPYVFPPLSLLKAPKSVNGDSMEYLKEMSERLARTLKNFGVDAQVTEVTRGPSVTRFEILPAEGVKVSKIVNLRDDMKLNLAVTDLRIEAPIPGKRAVGIEVPNKEKIPVGFAELVSSDVFRKNKSDVAFCVGKDIAGEIIVGNIDKMPHMLIAGATGSGKSVCINTIIMSLLYHSDPNDVKLILVDPKKVELSGYNGIPHLLIPVVTDPKKASGALHWAVKEMEDRYTLLEEAGVRNIEAYNEKVVSGYLTKEVNGETIELPAKKLPRIVIILDELADLMMVAASDVEDSIVRITQLARAAGIYLIIATQRPSVNVITGLIKANVPSRIAFQVSNGTDSRVILDMTGAEDLLGYGDMLYAPRDLNKPIRVQGAFVEEEEVARVVDFIKKNNASTADENLIENHLKEAAAAAGVVSISEGMPDSGRDSLFAEAGRFIIESEKSSIGALQRKFSIGFNRAARIMDQLAEADVVGPEMGTKPREIKMTMSEFEELLID